MFAILALAAVCMPLIIAAVRAYRLASGSRFVITRDITDAKFDPRYRVAVLQDGHTQLPIAVAIERGPSDAVRADLPTFCTRQTWVRTSGRTATMVMDIRIGGEIIVPSEQVQVFTADWGQAPRKNTLTQKQYAAITGLAILPNSDEELWTAFNADSTD